MKLIIAKMHVNCYSRNWIELSKCQRHQGSIKDIQRHEWHPSLKGCEVRDQTQPMHPRGMDSQSGDSRVAMLIFLWGICGCIYGLTYPHYHPQGIYHIIVCLCYLPNLPPPFEHIDFSDRVVPAICYIIMCINRALCFAIFSVKRPRFTFLSPFHHKQRIPSEWRKHCWACILMVCFVLCVSESGSRFISLLSPMDICDTGKYNRTTGHNEEVLYKQQAGK